MEILEFLKINTNYGDGSGDGSGSSYGSGSGDGYGIISFCGDTVYYIDGIPTIIKNIKGNVAKGFILNSDLTLEPCYVAKKNNYFAHGKTLKKAVNDVIAKEIADMNIDAKISEFKKTFQFDKKYSGHEFSKWYHILTGSCDQGRESFIKNNNINLDDEFTIDEFVKMCKNSYGSDIIQKLRS